MGGRLSAGVLLPRVTAASIVLALLPAVCTHAATGSVVYTGATIGTPGFWPGTASPISQVFDRNVATEWLAASPSGAWAGTDFGSSAAVALNAYRVAAGVAGYAGQINRLAGAKIQASNDCTFATGVVTLDTVPSAPYYPRYSLAPRNERPLEATQPYRCYRYLSATNGYGGVSELQWIGPAGAASIEARPVTPVISPGAGAFLSGSVIVTITTKTTSAALYYTTDGTAPTVTNGILYTGPFTLPVDGLTILRVVAYDSSLSMPLSDIAVAHYRNYAFKPNDDWYDDDGILMEAHAPSITGPVRGRYYMVGQFANKGNVNGADIGANEGVWMYSSDDLLNWHWEGQILDNAGWNYVERPHIIHSAATGKYVLWAHMANSHNSTDRAGVATAPEITGPWTWQNAALNPDNNGFKDFNLFQDDDGTAYVVYVTGSQGSVTISQLSPDYLGSTGISVGGLIPGREAPVLFKHESAYFLISSSTNYYNSVTGTFNLDYIVCASCESPLGQWSTARKNLFSSEPGAGQPYNTQTASLLRVAGRRDAYLLMTDYYNPSSLYDSRQTWIPLAFPAATSVEGATPAMFDLSIWPPEPPRARKPDAILP
jgi:hypothetical protein